jgi:hypothetical protein
MLFLPRLFAPRRERFTNTEGFLECGESVVVFAASG